MKKYFYIYLIFLFPELAFSYITFPLLKDSPSFSQDDSPSEIMEKLFDSNLYILMNIGSENIDVKTYLDNERFELMIAGKGIKNSKYNESNSESYNCTYCKEKEYSYGQYFRGIISTENFKIKFNEKEMKTISNMNFVLGTQSYYLDPPEAFVGLTFERLDSEKNYNLFKSLKLTNSTVTYNWYLNFTENDSKMIIDAFPHDFDNKYDKAKLNTAKTLNDGYYLIWGLIFSNIYYDNENNNISLTDNTRAKIDFSFNYIMAPNNTGDYLENIFFNEYYSKNICFKKGINNNKQYFIYCQNSNNFNPENFKSIYFKSLELNSIFEFSYKDLFYYKDNYIYFLILFQKENYWAFGELFLAKYFLLFNHDQKILAFYQNYENKGPNDNDDSGGNKFIYSIVYIVIGVAVLIIIGIISIFFVKALKNKRKIRANELEECYIYDAKEKNSDQIDYLDSDSNKGENSQNNSRNNSESKID